VPSCVLTLSRRSRFDAVVRAHDRDQVAGCSCAEVICGRCAAKFDVLDIAALGRRIIAGGLAGRFIEAPSQRAEGANPRRRRAFVAGLLTAVDAQSLHRGIR
jgi:hypothetical protein